MNRIVDCTHAGSQDHVVQMRPEALHAADQDVGINAPVRYAWNEGSESRYFTIDEVNGTVSMARDLADNELVQPVTLVVKVNILSLDAQLQLDELNWRML